MTKAITIIAIRVTSLYIERSMQVDHLHPKKSKMISSENHNH